jgi:hypothetical protein
MSQPAARQQHQPQPFLQANSGVTVIPAENLGAVWRTVYYPAAGVKPRTQRNALKRLYRRIRRMTRRSLCLEQQAVSLTTTRDPSQQSVDKKALMVVTQQQLAERNTITYFSQIFRRLGIDGVRNARLVFRTQKRLQKIVTTGLVSPLSAYFFNHAVRPVRQASRGALLRSAIVQRSLEEESKALRFAAKLRRRETRRELRAFLRYRRRWYRRHFASAAAIKPSTAQFGVARFAVAATTRALRTRNLAKYYLMLWGNALSRRQFSVPKAKRRRSTHKKARAIAPIRSCATYFAKRQRRFRTDRTYQSFR